jgi:hypothetical protein
MTSKPGSIPSAYTRSRLDSTHNLDLATTETVACMQHSVAVLASITMLVPTQIHAVHAFAYGPPFARTVEGRALIHG